MSTTPIASIDTLGARSATAARPAWLDERLFPFVSRYVAVDGHRLHYIDEGTGPTLLFLHPGVGWSFSYRGVIARLRERFRCVAVDLPGFGLSTAAPGYRHTLASDSLLAEQFIQALGLRDVTLYSQDITGSVGLGAVARHPEWFRAVVIGPGFAWPLREYPGIARMVRLIGSPVARWLGITTNFFLEYYLKNVTRKPRQQLSAGEKLAYRGPMRDRAVRRHPHDLFASAVRSGGYLADLERDLRALDGMPAVLVFGETDGLVKMGWLARFEGIFPRHRSIVLAGCHHFPQEYDPGAVADAISHWWDEEIVA
jgi:haloalkane dehalogenase